MHLTSKLRHENDGGSRIGIVLNGSPLFTGGAGSGESEIRRYLIENDLLEAIIKLSNDMFYNTGIATYVWILTNCKPSLKRGKVQLIDASSFNQKMRKNLGEKRKEMNDDHIATVTQLFGDFVEANLAIIYDNNGKEIDQKVFVLDKTKSAHLSLAPDGCKLKQIPISKIFSNSAFGYSTITVERPLRDEAGNIILASSGKLKGKPQPDCNLRDTENIPLDQNINDYFKKEVLPHVPDAWIDHDKTKIGYEISFNRYFYVFEPLRSLEEIDLELKETEQKIREMLEAMWL